MKTFIQTLGLVFSIVFVVSFLVVGLHRAAQFDIDTARAAEPTSYVKLYSGGVLIQEWPKAKNFRTAGVCAYFTDTNGADITVSGTYSRVVNSQ